MNACGKVLLAKFELAVAAVNMHNYTRFWPIKKNVIQTSSMFIHARNMHFQSDFNIKIFTYCGSTKIGMRKLFIILVNRILSRIGVIIIRIISRAVYHTWG